MRQSTLMDLPSVFDEPFSRALLRGDTGESQMSPLVTTAR